MFTIAKNNSEFIYYSKYKEIGGNNDSGSDNISNPNGINSNSAKSANEKKKKLSKKGSSLKLNQAETTLQKKNSAVET